MILTSKDFQIIRNQIIEDKEIKELQSQRDAVYEYALYKIKLDDCNLEIAFSYEVKYLIKTINERITARKNAIINFYVNES